MHGHTNFNQVDRLSIPYTPRDIYIYIFQGIQLFYNNNSFGQVKGLRRSRAAAKANITKEIKGLTEWKMTCDNLIDAQAKVKELSDMGESLYTAHSNYHDDDEYDVIYSEEYLQTGKKRIENIRLMTG